MNSLTDISGLLSLDHSAADDEISVVNPAHGTVQVGRRGVVRVARLRVRGQHLDRRGLDVDAAASDEQVFV